MKIEIRILILVIFSFAACKESSNSSGVSNESIVDSTPNTAAVDQSGGEDFNEINATILNGRLAMEERSMEVEDVAKLLFLPGGNGSGDSELSVTKNKLENGNIETVIINENLNHPSRRAEKFIMVLRLKDNIWQIVSLKKNWRCKKDRTYQVWGTGEC